MHKLKRRLAVVVCAVLTGLVMGMASVAGDAEPAGELIVEARDAGRPVDAEVSPLIGASTAEPSEEATTTSSMTDATSTSTMATDSTTASSTTTATTAPPPSSTTTTTTTAPPPPPPPPPSGSPEDAIARWFPEVYDKAVDVARCESGMNPSAVSPGGGNHGLFQINTVHRESFASVTGVSWEDGIYVAEHNTRFARWLYDDQGWSPWTCA